MLLGIQERDLAAIPLWPYRKVHPDALRALFDEQFVERLLTLVADV